MRDRDPNKKRNREKRKERKRKGGQRERGRALDNLECARYLGWSVAQNMR